MDIRKRTIGVHELGVEFVEDQLGIDNLYEAANSPLVSYLNNSLKAKELFQRDKDYIVRDGEVLIVDEFTGRVLIGRRYNEGMHQAIEAKENVEIKAENQTLATITLQNYFRLYDKLAGMTGTAETEAAELHEIYKLGVVTIPTNRDMIRTDQTDLIYQDRGSQSTSPSSTTSANATRRASRSSSARPASSAPSTCRGSSEPPHPAQRAERQVPRAGGEHHRRGGPAQARSRWPPTWPAAAPTSCWAATSTSSPTCGCATARPGPGREPEEYEAAWHEELKVKAEAAAEAEDVIAVGGLYVLGTERHESRRIDNQLRGRSGTPGRPGRVPVLPVAG